jgi:hypothetical protein
MSGKPGKVNPFLKMIIESIKTASPSSFHPCPYFGVESISNMTAPRSFITFSPVVKYKIKSKVTDGTKFIYELIYFIKNQTLLPFPTPS